MLQKHKPELMGTLEALVDQNLSRLFRGSLEFQPVQIVDSGEYDGKPIITARIEFSGRRGTRDDARKFVQLTIAVQSKLRDDGLSMTFCPSFSSSQGWEDRVYPPV